MRVLVPALATLVCLQAAPQTRVDPKISSIHPFTVQRGSSFDVTVRGAGLAGTIGANIENAPLTIAVGKIGSEQPGASNGRNKTPADLVTLRVEVRSDAAPGRYPIRLITPNGITNALPLNVVDLPVTAEPEGLHDSRDSAVMVTAIPAVFAGRLSQRGESDIYAFSATAGQTLTFEVVSGLPQIASGGSAATVANFDPALSIFEADGSWFDAGRLKLVAHNDEPVWVFGRSTDPHLVHRFAKSGTYLLRIEAFAGQGGPDYSYQLKIRQGEVPQDTSIAPVSDWQERAWSRRLHSNRLKELAGRGGKDQEQSAVETYYASAEGTTFKIPATLEGAIAKPGEAHKARFRADGPVDLAIEVETPAAYSPFFNPIVRLVNGSGQEVATNVFAGRGACSGAMSKSLQAKTIVPLRDPGEYTVEIRDATADLASPDFKYRVQIRPQIPHLGEIRIDADHLNLIPGEAKTVRVHFDREEDYRGAVAITAESLPPGISAAVGADFEPDKDDPPVTGKRERYTPRTERAVLVLNASSEAMPFGQPHSIRFVVRPLTDGKLGEIVATKSIYVMVVQKP